MAEANTTTRRVPRLMLVMSTVVLAACPPDPGPVSLNFNLTERDSLIALGRALVYRTEHGSGDRQRLLAIGWFHRRHYGTDAEIQPADSSFKYTLASLLTGRIVARVITRGPDTYPKYRLPALDTSYLWVKWSASDSLAIFIPTDSTKVMGRAWLARDTALTAHTMALASWMWDPNDEKVWVTCTNNYCCRVGN